ncbi:MAG: glycerophosphoryl diester phosphodiesterase [Alphaproteobacteria bacterium]|nr:glycerophosphoryl diester phosphodiesterase [Alphaproteobacteria bacterium]MDB5740128.1 glycerophosphoryl diester phosphodiesterase [Alphaproteobacteria bacterium]
MPKNIAHRGGAGLMPENTLAAFADALARSCDGAELDVQLSADGEVVVHHDFRLMADVARKDDAWLTTPGPRIKDLTLAQLRQFDIGRPMPGSAYAAKHPMVTPVDGATVPTLKQVLDLIAARPFTLMVELKCDLSDDSADPVALADAAFDVCAGSNNILFVGFDWRALTRIRARGGACWFTTDKLQGDARPVIDMIAAAGGQGWFPSYLDATPDNVAYAREHGLKVGAWTVNDPADIQRLSGLDAICTDRPDLLHTLRQAQGEG